MTTAAPHPLAVTLNGQPHALASGTTVADLIAQQRITPEAVATALNGCFVARCQRAQHVLQPGDNVTTFQPIEGG